MFQIPRVLRLFSLVRTLLCIAIPLCLEENTVITTFSHEFLLCLVLPTKTHFLQRVLFCCGFSTMERVFFLHPSLFKVFAVFEARQPFTECSQRCCQHRTYFQTMGLNRPCSAEDRTCSPKKQRSQVSNKSTAQETYRNMLTCPTPPHPSHLRSINLT